MVNVSRETYDASKGVASYPHGKQGRSRVPFLGKRKTNISSGQYGTVTPREGYGVGLFDIVERVH